MNTSLTHNNPLLTEGDVIHAVCIELTKYNYVIEQELTVKEHGDDIVAVKGAGKNKIELHIEAKGETSSDPNSTRYGKPFDNAQVRDHVGAALYKVAEILSRGEANTLVGIALPKSDLHKKTAMNIDHALKLLGVILFWVSNEQVEIELPDGMSSL